ncbi:MAG: TonB-dependent receptor [Saprospiraceae bacterium]|nr:MAG: TonB-dependent receptor [Saprospiraceae bacterium]
MKKIILLSGFLLCFLNMFAQKGGTIRGNVYDKATGEPIIFGTVMLKGTTIGSNTNEDGFFSIGNVPVGRYNLMATYIGYDSVWATVNVTINNIVTQNLYMSESSIQLSTVDVSARKEKAKSDVQVSKVTVTASQIKSLPSTGGQTDIAQYLPVLPGIISTGDQGGQIYIRGGSPIQNKILLDGMTIYNPFHSIGFFSVFETETIKTVDVLTAGFDAQYGGRISAVIDLKTREGNKKRLAGLVSANPFQAKALIEGPLKKFEEGGGSTSFLITAKHSYIDKTSPHLYSYAVDTSFYKYNNDTLNGKDLNRLPFSFTDLYGKLSFLTSNGSKFNLFGFNFADDVNYVGVAKLGWNAAGGGTNFTLIPPNSNLVAGGTIAFSNYDLELKEASADPRTSNIFSYNVLLDFTYYGLNSEVNYGFEVNGLDTKFRFKNFIGNTINKDINTNELAGYIKLKQKIGNWIIEPGLRLQFYPSVPASNIEPRFGAKWNVTDDFRLKLAAGYYSQNLIASVNELDVVNLFVGFLAGPDETVKEPNGVDNAPHRLQKAIHGVVGAEVDLTNNLELNVEPYYKRYTQLIQLNRNKLEPTDPDFVTENGDAYGIDFTFRYQKNDFYAWATYSLAQVTRYDGEQTYPTIFDRRHNINLLATYQFGQKKDWEAAVRWNLGSGFPFTLTQGFYNDFNFENGLESNPITGNGDLGVVLDGKRNGGRLPYYHRLDLSLKRTLSLGKFTKMEVVASVTNAYSRDNIFYFDRIRNQRVNQLPILPSLGLTISF